MAYLDEMGVETLTAEIKDYADDTYNSKWTLLWENASPTSEFAAQTVSLNLIGYDAVFIYFGNHIPKIYASRIIIVGEPTYVVRFPSNNSTNARFYGREVTVNTDGIVFADASYFQQGNSSLTVQNTDNIPRKIYGIKGLFS